MKFFFLFIFFLSGFFLSQKSFIHKRNPANFVSIKNCGKLLNSIINSKNAKLDNSLIKEKTQFYLKLIENDFITSEKFGSLPEDFIAYLEAIKIKYGLNDQNLKLQKFSKSNIANIKGIIDQISNNKKSILSTDFELIESLFFNLYGNKLKFKDFLNYNETQDIILKRTLLLNIANHGLSYIFPELKKEKKFYSKFHNFTKSRVGRFLGTMLFNTPVIYGGVYPLFIPKLGLIKLSDEMMTELLLNGFNRENSRKFIESISMSLKNKFSLNLNNRARYELLRSYYLRGATLFTIAFLSYNFYQDRKFYRESNEEIEGLLNINDVILDLKSNGIDITKNNNIEPYECSEVKFCVEEYDLKIESYKTSSFYLDCKKEFAPEINCN